MKPDEPIHTGMLVWHTTGGTARVISVTMLVGEVRADGTVSTEAKTEVQLMGEDGVPFALSQNDFMAHYHRRLTGWERLDHLAIEDAQPYFGPLKGHHRIRLDDTKHFAIENRPRKPREMIHAEEHEALGGGYTSAVQWYENFVPTGWNLVLDPPL